MPRRTETFTVGKTTAGIAARQGASGVSLPRHTAQSKLPGGVRARDTTIWRGQRLSARAWPQHGAGEDPGGCRPSAGRRRRGASACGRGPRARVLRALPGPGAGRATRRGGGGGGQPVRRGGGRTMIVATRGGFAKAAIRQSTKSHLTNTGCLIFAHPQRAEQQACQCPSRAVSMPR